MGRLEIPEVIQSLGFDACLYHLPAVGLGEANMTSLSLIFSSVK